jgi:hypothetical protein
MSVGQRIKHEIAAMAVLTLYFGSWVAALMLLKWLLLAEYDIAMHDWVGAIVGVLLLAKVVLVVEHVSLGAWVSGQPAWVHVVARTAVFGVAVAVVMLLEKAFHARHEHGGFIASLGDVLQHRDVHHVWANAICIAGALLMYSALDVVRRHLGDGGFVRVFLAPLPPE